VRKNFRRVAAVSAVFLLGGLVGHAAFALPIATTGDGGGIAGEGPLLKYANQAVSSASKTGKSLESKALGLGGGGIGPIPAPTPGIRPEDTLNQAIQTVASALGDAALGLGGIGVGPIPAPTPGLHPEDLINGAIQTGASALGDAADLVGSVHVQHIVPSTSGLVSVGGIKTKKP
jgi:hypothetical protein